MKSRGSSLDDKFHSQPESKIKAVVISSIENVKMDVLHKKTCGNTTRQSPPKVLVGVDQASRQHNRSAHYNDDDEEVTLHVDNLKNEEN